MTVLCSTPLLLPLMVMEYVPRGVLVPPLCVVMVSVDELLVAPGVTDAGENEQTAPRGRPEHPRPTALLKLPPTAETVMVVWTWCPERTLRLDGDAESAKSTPVPESDTETGPLMASLPIVSVAEPAPAECGKNTT
jgi:hypothetical protein